MIISPCYKVDVEAVASRAQKGVWMACAAFLALSPLIFFIPDRSSRAETAGSVIFTEQDVISLDDIGRGPLALHPSLGPSLLPDLGKEIIILARSSKPGMHPSSASVLVSTRGSLDKRTIYSGEQVFVQQTKTESGETLYSFTDQRTPIWIRPLASLSEEVSMEIGIFSPSKDKEGFFEEVSEVIVPEVRMTKEGGYGNSSYLSSLKEARYFGADLFFKAYGGKEYREMTAKMQLEIPSEAGVDVHYVSSGDYLEWHGGAWHSVSFDSIASDTPLVLVKNITAKEMELQVWDEKGFYPETIRLAMLSQSPTSKTELSSSAMRLKTSTQLACTLGRRRLVIKEGDWLLKVGRSWRVLRRAGDIDSYVHHKIRGELFVFDTLERQGGKTYVKGHLFDEMRTQMIPLSLAVEAEAGPKEKEKKTKARGALVKKKRGAQ